MAFKLQRSLPGAKTPSRLLTLTLLAWLIGGCSLLQPGPSPQAPVLSWSKHAERLNAQQHWSIKGKIGIRQHNDNSSANLNWTQQQQQYHIFMSGPLGQGAVDIQGSGQGVMMQVSGEGTYFAASPEALLEQRLGWSLPLSNLNYWVKGLPSPNSPYQKSLDANNRLATLVQDNWRISYLGYHQLAGAALPRKMVLNQGDQLRVTLIIKEWDLSLQPG